MERIRLEADKAGLKVGGVYLCILSMTDRARELLNDDGWDRENESWLDYRIRTASEREIECSKRVQLAKDIVDAYNEKYFKGE